MALIPEELAALGFRLQKEVGVVQDTLDVLGTDLWLRKVAVVGDILVDAKNSLAPVLESQRPLDKITEAVRPRVLDAPESLQLTESERSKAAEGVVLEELERDPASFFRKKNAMNLQAQLYLRSGFPIFMDRLVPTLERLCDICFGATRVGIAAMAEGKGFTPSIEEVDALLAEGHTDPKFKTLLAQVFEELLGDDLEKQDSDITTADFLSGLYTSAEDEREETLTRRVIEEAENILSIRRTIRPTSDHTVLLAEVDREIRPAVACLVVSFKLLESTERAHKLASDYSVMEAMETEHAAESREGCSRFMPEPIQRWVAGRARAADDPTEREC